jgi:hypothetical protein
VDLLALKNLSLHWAFVLGGNISSAQFTVQLSGTGYGQYDYLRLFVHLFAFSQSQKKSPDAGSGKRGVNVVYFYLDSLVPPTRLISFGANLETLPKR